MNNRTTSIGLLIKLSLAFFLLFGLILKAAAQVKIGDNPTSTHPSAVLEVESTNKGYLKPRLTSAQRTAISTPATGLEVFDTDTKSTWYYNGTVWVESIGRNLYNTDGTLTDNRVVTQGTSSLSFTATGTNAFSIDGTTFSVDAANNAVGFGTINPNPNAVIDATAVNKGVLLPRVALTATSSASPLSAFVAGMTVYNTATAGTGATAVTPGLYYSDGSKWILTGKDNTEDPVLGSIAVFPYNVIPSGYLECNGAAISRTVYAALFAKIGTTYGAGDGSTTFNLPDLRGEFIRGWDNGRGVDAGRTLGSTQTGATKLPNSAFSISSVGDHTHSVDPPNTSTSTNGSHTHGITRRSNSDNNSFDTGNGRAGESSAATTDRSVVGSFNTYGAGDHSHTVDIPAFTSAAGGAHTHSLTGGDSETRPRNVAMVFAIKAVESILVPASSSTGVAAAAAVNEPWYKVGTTTGATANTDNVYINGNVGIGANTPAARLHVTSPNNFLTMWESSAGISGSKVLGLLDNALDGAFKFSARNDDYTLKQDLLTLDLPTGNVAIGTPTVSTYTLTVGRADGTKSGSIWVNPQNSATEGGEISLAKDLTYGTKNWVIDQYGGNGTASDLPRFRVFAPGSAAEGISITEPGNVGISNSNPQYALDVNGKVATNNELVINSSDGNNGGSIRTTGEANTSNGLIIENGRGAGKIIFNTNNGSTLAERMRITATGNVGIGTSTPASTLTVGKENGTVPGFLQLNPTNTVAEGGQIILAKDLTYGTKDWIIDQYGGTGVATNQPRLRIFTAGSPEAIAIGENGYVKVGGTTGANTTATTPLDVEGALRVGTSAQTAAAAGAGAIRYNGGNMEYSNGTSWITISTSTPSTWVGPSPMSYATTAGTLTVGTVYKNQVRYRKTSDDTEVFWEFSCDAGGSGTSGTYLFTLPAGITFNLTRYPAYTTLTSVPGAPTSAQLLAMGNSIIAAEGSFLHCTSNYHNFYIVPYSATQFRILGVFTNGSVPRFMNTSDWAISACDKPILTARFNTGNP